MTEELKDGDGIKDDGKVEKAEFDRVTSDLDKTKGDLEDMRMEVMSPEYLEFLNAKEKGEEKKTEEKKEELPDDDFEKLSKKELFTRAKDAAKKEMQGELDTLKQSNLDAGKAKTASEVAAFARQHPEEFPKYRAAMYGISLDPKNKGLTLGELLVQAKDYVKGLHLEPSPEEKARLKKATNEKPGGDSESFDDLRKLDTDDATKKAMDDVEEKLGPMPEA